MQNNPETKKDNKNINELDLTGKVSVITGGTSGIGLAIAKSFFAHNSSVIITGRDKKRGKSALEQVKSQVIRCPENVCGPKAVYMKCDSGNHDEVKQTCENILKKFSKADILVLNAAIEFAEAINEVDPKTWQRMIDVNINGAFYFVRYLTGPMIEQSYGNIILLSSVAKITGAGAGVHYPTTKAALSGLMARINYELLSKGVRSNMISPGIADTPMLRKKYPDTEEVNSKLVDQVPMGRIAKPEEIANLALFLASDISSYICGQDILIDGGRLYYRRPGITLKK